MNDYMLNSEIESYILAQIERGSPFGRNTEGWRQLQRDLRQMHSDTCRTDAVGRISKHDLARFEKVVNKLRGQGKIGPEWNGCLTIR